MTNRFMISSSQILHPSIARLLPFAEDNFGSLIPLAKT